MRRNGSTLHSAVLAVSHRLPALEAGPEPDEEDRFRFVELAIVELRDRWALETSSLVESGSLPEVAAALSLASAYAWSEATGASWDDPSLGHAVAVALRSSDGGGVSLSEPTTFARIMRSEMTAKATADSAVATGVEFLGSSFDHRRRSIADCFEEQRNRSRSRAAMSAAVVVVAVASLAAVLAVGRWVGGPDDRQQAEAPGAPSTLPSTAATTAPPSSMGEPSTTESPTSQTSTAPTTAPGDETSARADVPVAGPASGDPPLGDHYRPTRPDNSVGVAMAPGETLVVDVEVDRVPNGRWLALDVRCLERVRTWPELDLAINVTAESEPVYWAPSNPVTDCSRQLVQGPVEPGQYRYLLQADESEVGAQRVEVIARWVHPPIEPYWDGRVVLPQHEDNLGHSLAGVLSPGTVDAYRFYVSRNDQLLLAFSCSEVKRPPTEVALRFRLVHALDGSTVVDDRVVDGCEPFSAPTVPSDGPYELQIMAADRSIEIDYRSGAPLQ